LIGCSVGVSVALVYRGTLVSREAEPLYVVDCARQGASG